MAKDIDREQIVAAYGEGQDMADIAQRYGVSRAEIERIVADESQPEPEPAKRRRTRRRAPAPVVAAMLIVALYGLVRVASVMTGPAVSATTVTLTVVGGIAYALVAVGIWSGWPMAQWVGGLGGTVAVVTGAGVEAEPSLPRLALGALLIGALFVPEQSRDWFARMGR